MGLLIGLSALIFGESALLGAATVYLLVELAIAQPQSYASAIALTALVAVTTAWLAVIAINVLRARPWVRGAIVTSQLLQLAVGVGCFQGYVARPEVGWLLVAPALAALILLFTRPVIAATARSSN